MTNHQSPPSSLTQGKLDGASGGTSTKVSPLVLYLDISEHLCLASLGEVQALKSVSLSCMCTGAKFRAFGEAWLVRHLHRAVHQVDFQVVTPHIGSEFDREGDGESALSPNFPQSGPVASNCACSNPA